MTVGQVIAHLNRGEGLKLHAPYSGVIWPKAEGTTENLEPVAIVKLKDLQFTRPRVIPVGMEHLHDDDYVLGPLPDATDPEGMLPRGELSLVAGSSGRGKSTVLYDVLERQKAKETIFGRESYNRPYLVILRDRSNRSVRKTFRRLGLEFENVDYHVCTASENKQAIALTVKEQVEARSTMPHVVVIEGLDMACKDQSGMDSVVAHLDPLLEVAGFYHLAIIGTMGAPKLKVRDSFVSQRDNVFGSTAWSRRSESIWVFQPAENDRVALSMLPRHSAPQKVLLEWDRGRLVEVKQEQLESEESNDMIQWIVAKGQFTRPEINKAFPRLSGTTLNRRLTGLLTSGIIRKHQNQRRGEFYQVVVEVEEPVI
jgi:hypothetical protein